MIPSLQLLHCSSATDKYYLGDIKNQSLGVGTVPQWVKLPIGTMRPMSEWHLRHSYLALPILLPAHDFPGTWIPNTLMGDPPNGVPGSELT